MIQFPGPEITITRRHCLPLSFELNHIMLLDHRIIVRIQLRLTEK